MEPKPFTWTKTADEIFNSPHIFNELAPAGQIVIVAAFRSSTASMCRLHQAAMYLERQTQFGDIPWPREGSAGTYLDPAQPVADGVRVANKHRSRTTHRRIVVLPHPKRFKQHLPVLVGKIAKTVQRSADRFDQHLRRADRSDGQDGAVEHAAGHRRRGLPDAAAAASLHTLAVLPASTTGGTLGRILLRPVIPGRERHSPA